MEDKKKKKATSLKSVRGYEVEAEVFVRLMKRLHPKVTVRELVRLLAKYKKIRAGYDWVSAKVNSLEIDYLLDNDPRWVGEERAKVNKMEEDDIHLINQSIAKDITAFVEDSKQVAKEIKSKMLDEVDIRISNDPEEFSNDELLRGAKILHDIENNTSEQAQVNINVNIDEINNTINELKRKQAIEVDGS